MVVTPTNEAAAQLNEHMLDQLEPEGERVCYSRDEAVAEVSMLSDYSPEFLHSVLTGGLPPHELKLRPGALVLSLRKYAPQKGLCNGTRLVVERIHRHLLVVRIITGPFKGRIEAIPRICCDSAGDHELPFILRRHQFPVKHGWCITINKSQGQNVRQRLGIYLPTPVFAHGQLYVPNNSHGGS